MFFMSKNKYWKFKNGCITFKTNTIAARSNVTRDFNFLFRNENDYVNWTPAENVASRRILTKIGGLIIS